MSRWAHLARVAVFVVAGCAGSSKSEHEGGGAAPGSGNGGGGTSATAGSGGTSTSSGSGGTSAGQSGAAAAAGRGAELPEAPCERAGGVVQAAMCCDGAGEFPNQCNGGACSCSPENSTLTRVCSCSQGCWNGTECVVTPEAACLSGRGTVTMLNCCAGVGDFPNTCAQGVCDCSPENSAPVTGCACGIDECFVPGEGCLIF